MHRLILLLLLVSCGLVFKPKPTEVDSRSTLQLLASKSNLYTDLVASHQDAHGFIMTEKCDALLFSGLLSAARPDLQVAIRAAQSADGAWHRRPGQDCGPELGNSRSTISRDMMLGLFWHIWRHKDLDLAVETMDMLKDNLYYMPGEGTLGELFMTPVYMNTLAEMIQKMGGPRYGLELAFPVTFGDDTGFIAHLTTWHILLRGEILGQVEESELDILKHHAARQPINPLFAAAVAKYTDGNQSKAVALLLNAAEWPADRLPTSTEHCDDWPIQRDDSEKDWGPCVPLHEHTGAELVTIYELIIR